MISNKAVGSMTLVIIAVAGIRIFAAEQTASELYGQGVHAYFASDYDSAIASLSAAIKQNSGDPRAYYFRGLATAARDGLDAGLADIAKGADVEVNRIDERLYDVNGALQRVQGTLRLELEKQRSAARVAAAEKKQRQDRVKYEELKRREDIVLFQPDRPIQKIDLELPVVDLGGSDPFVSGVAFSGGNAVKSAAPVAVDPSTDALVQPGAEGEAPRDPFGNPAEKSDNPFGDMTPAEKPPTAEKEPDASNPFGDDMAEIAPDDPVFDENVKPELPPSMNVGGTILDLLGKTFSGAASEAPNRDPFGEDEPAVPPAPAADDAGAPPAQKAEPDTNPFD